jgi:hypothetical protein
MLARAVVLLAFLAHAAPATADTDEDWPLLDAPATCLAPVGGDGLAEAIARGPTLLGTYKLANTKDLDTPVLRLRAYGQFIPTRLGAKTGEVQARFEAGLLPDVKRDGASYKNTSYTSAPGSLRIGPYRVTTRVLDARALTYEATVERIGCFERAMHPPLARGSQLALWLSTEGTRHYEFGTNHLHANLFLYINADLAPDVQQDDPKGPHGYLSFTAGNGSMSYEDSKMLNQDTLAGAKFVLHQHRFEILKVVYGKDTVVSGGRVYTKGKAPIASVLVRVTAL